MTGSNEPVLSSPITVVGDDEVTVTGDDLAALPSRERAVRIDCNSGDHYTAVWRGVEVSALLELASVPGDTTHLLVESEDGYRVCVDVETALDALLAFFRDGRPLAEVADHESRFVAAGVDGPRTTKDVATLEAVALSPAEDPERLEELLLNERSE